MKNLFVKNTNPGGLLIKNYKVDTSLFAQKTYTPKPLQNQKDYLRSIRYKKFDTRMLSMFSDYDGDLVINGLDCKGLNRNEHGFFQKAANWVRGRGFQEGMSAETTKPADEHNLYLEQKEQETALKEYQNQFLDDEYAVVNQPKLPTAEEQKIAFEEYKKEFRKEYKTSGKNPAFDKDTGTSAIPRIRTGLRFSPHKDPWYDEEEYKKSKVYIDKENEPSKFQKEVTEEIGQKFYTAGQKTIIKKLEEKALGVEKKIDTKLDKGVKYMAKIPGKIKEKVQEAYEEYTESPEYEQTVKTRYGFGKHEEKIDRSFKEQLDKLNEQIEDSGAFNKEYQTRLNKKSEWTSTQKTKDWKDIFKKKPKENISGEYEKTKEGYAKFKERVIHPEGKSKPGTKIFENLWENVKQDFSEAKGKAERTHSKWMGYRFETPEDREKLKMQDVLAENERIEKSLRRQLGELNPHDYAIQEKRLNKIIGQGNQLSEGDYNKLLKSSQADIRYMAGKYVTEKRLVKESERQQTLNLRREQELSRLNLSLMGLRGEAEAARLRQNISYANRYKKTWYGVGKSNIGIIGSRSQGQPMIGVIKAPQNVPGSARLTAYMYTTRKQESIPRRTYVSMLPALNEQQSRGRYDPNAPKFVYRQQYGSFTRKSNKLMAGQNPMPGEVVQPSFESKGMYPKTKPLMNYQRIYVGKGKFVKRGRPKKRASSSFIAQTANKRPRFYEYTDTYKWGIPRISS